jgi:MFS family permease
LKQLAFVRSGNIDDERIRQEFHELVASHEFRRRFEPGYRGIFKSPALRKRLAYGFYVTSLQQIGGIAAVTMFAVVIYKSLGWNGQRQSLIINGVQGVLQLFIVLVNTFTVDRYGRRPLLIAGFIIQSLALLILASLTTGFPQNNNKPAAVIEVAMLFVVGLTYCWSNGPMCFAIASEIFPQHVREKALGLSLLGQTICLIALTQPWPYFNEKAGGKSYWLLFSLNVVALVQFPDKQQFLRIKLMA